MNKKKIFLIAVVVLVLASIAYFALQSSTVEGRIMLAYNNYVWGANMQGGGYICNQPPEINEMELTYLKPINKVYSVWTHCSGPDCFVGGYHGPCTTLGDLVAYEKDGQTIIFDENDVDEYFSEIFEPLDSGDAAVEYADLERDAILYTLEDLFDDVDYLSYEDCNFFSEAPEVKNVITQQADGFIYEGFGFEPVGRMDLYYYKYYITNNGEISLIENEHIADCGEGIIY